MVPDWDSSIPGRRRDAVTGSQTYPLHLVVLSNLANASQVLGKAMSHCAKTSPMLSRADINAAVNRH